MTEPLTDEEIAQLAVQRQQEQDTEYGQYTASQDIYHDGVIAYLKGSPVPASNVQQYAYDKNGLVDKVQSKSAAVAAAKKEG